VRAGTLTWAVLGRLGVTPPAEPSGGYRVARIGKATALAPEWDALASSYFQTRAFLDHLEHHAPCDQRYYEQRDGDETLVAGAVLCTIVIDLLTYSRVRSPVRVAMICIPCDQSAPGLLGARGPVSALAQRLLLEEQRFLAGLNLDAPLGLAQYIEARSLPTVVLDRRFASYPDYLAALRAPYRRRLKRIAARFDDVVEEHGDCAGFDDEMYQLYLQAYQRSNEKLRRLPFPFFTHLPAPFVLSTYRRGGRLLGWHICLADRDCFTFFLEGHVTEDDIYFNLLLRVLRQGIDSGCARIDLGQTAEVPKTRLGGRLVEKVMVGTHPHIAVRTMVQLARPLIAYRRRVPSVRVFREPGEQTLSRDP